MQGTARARHCAIVRRQSALQLPGSSGSRAAWQMRHLEAKSAGKLGRGAPRRFGFEWARVHDMNHAVGPDDAGFPPVTGSIVRHSAFSPWPETYSIIWWSMGR